MSQTNEPRIATVSRRGALKLLGIGTVGAASSAAVGCSSQQNAKSKKVDVVVVGAGFAGMVAARELMRKGKSVLVLEARDRVGGRVKAGKIAGQLVDVGGMWVGPTQTRLLAMIKEHELSTYPQFESGKALTELAGKRTYGDEEDLGLDSEEEKEVDSVSAEA